MSDHLPECDLAKQCRNNSHHDDSGYGDCLHCGQVCECDRLRACEQRVRASEFPLGVAVGKHDGFLEGYAAALDAAREAVLALCDCNDRWGPCEMKRMAAAIDALVKGSENNE